MTERRYYVRSPDAGVIAGYDDPNAAGAVALDYGDGAHLVDTHAQAYHPIAQVVADGELAFVDIGGWGAGKLGLGHNLVEAVKKGHVAIVHAFLAKGADADAKDANGGPALLWAVAGGKAEIVELLLAHGADPGARDGDGTGALELARKRGKHAVIELLQHAGAVE